MVNPTTIKMNRRLKAIESILRDEQAERIEHLDKCYKQMRQMGMLQAGRTREEGGKGNNVGGETAEAPDPYDSMYNELQFQPAAPAQSKPISATPNNVPTSSTSTKTKTSEKIAKSSITIKKKTTKVRKSKPSIEGSSNSNDTSTIIEASEGNNSVVAAAEESQIAPQEKIKVLEMLEPRFEEHFNPERRKKKKEDDDVKTRDTAKEREKKWAKLARRERRGAIKELRKDAKHLAGLYAEKQRKIRRERDEKTKKIMQSLEVQESEYKKLRAISGKLK